MKKLICFLCIFLITIFSGCTDKEPIETGETTDSQDQAHINVPASDALNDENAPASAEPTFKCEALEMPEELKDADHIYCCYSDSKGLVLSICNVREKEVTVGPVNKTDFLVLCDENAKIVNSFPVSFPDSYVTTAVPYKDGVAYVGYSEISDENSDDTSKKLYTEWYVVYTDGEGEKILDSGNSESYYDIPHLFIADNELCYLWGYDDGFVVKQIKDDGAILLFERTDCKLASVDIYSNGNEYCFMASYPEAEYATFFICDISGVKYEYTLHGKITSFSIMDEYAVCATGDGETSKFSIEAVELSNGDAKVYRVPDTPYCLTGNGGDLLYRNSLQYYYTSVADEKTQSIREHLLEVNNGLYYPLGESQYFVLGLNPDNDGDSEYEFFRLTISE